ncbi:glycosyl hydrolase family 18 protein [Puia sp. P3]|uniref:glycosyl hydrolase family 18 protein n=1 Tax=Puia sp. P3 TaxID=3423952 RepID=UPI003D66CA1E
MRKNSVLTWAAALVLLLSSCRKDISVSSTTGTVPRAATATNFKVMGYLTSWAGNVSQVQFGNLTHVTYAFLIPTSSGGYQPVDNPSKLSSMVSSAHASGVKALISVGGGGGGGGFAGIVASPANITNFVNNMLAFCNQYGLDGVDIDWEYPSTGTQATNFQTMLTQLSTALHNSGRILSIAVIGLGGDYVLSGVFNVVDIVMVMAYDDNNFQHSTYELATQCMAYWLGRGCPASKAILGVPFYGHDSSQDPNSDAAEVNYNTILSKGASPSLDVYSTFGYNGLLTMKSKTSYAMSVGGGIGIWELSGDATGASSLLSAIKSVVNAGGAVNTNAPTGTTVTFRGNNGLYVSSENGTKAMTCTRTVAQGWESFLVVDAGHGKVALQAMSKYVSSEDGQQAITCNRTAYSTWEVFDWITAADGNVTLRSTNGLFVSSDNGAKSMTCTRTAAQGWEEFGINQ